MASRILGVRVAANHLRIILRSRERGENVFFTTMVDLHVIHAGFPGLDEAETLRHMPDKRVEGLEQAFGEDISYDRFVPCIQLHEYEAYLFDVSRYSA